MKIKREQLEQLVARVLREDVGSGDWTSKWLIPEARRGQGEIVVKESGVIAGLEVAKLVFEEAGKGKVKFEILAKDGTKARKRARVALVSGQARRILTAERVALNFLQRMSGIASLTNRFVEAVKGTKAVILDTRKTVPGLRLLDKWAVKLGGGQNHRLGLYDMVLVKDNHLEIAGGIRQVMERLRRKNKLGLEVEVEVESLAGLREALDLGVKRILLDNMTLRQIKEAVGITKDRAKLEVSGGVNLKKVREIAKAGINYISIGALTHSVKALDMSLEMETRKTK